jgi:hypothetical protein
MALPARLHVSLARCSYFNWLHRRAPRPEATFAAGVTLNGVPYDTTIFPVEGTPEAPAPGDLVCVEDHWLVRDRLGPLDLVTRDDEPGTLFERAADGGLHRVAVRIARGAPNASDPSLLDRLAPTDLAALRSFDAQLWSPAIAAAVAALDPARVVLTLSGRATAVPTWTFPVLPRALRYLNLVSAGTPAGGFALLRELRELRLLSCVADVDAATSLDATDLQDLRALRVLELGELELANPASLAALVALRTLSVGDCTGLGDARFVRGMPALRCLDLSGSDARDLGDLAGHPSLEYVWADGTPVSRLPESRVPELRVLSLLEAPLPRGAVAAFSRTNPNCRVEVAARDALRAWLAGSDALCVRAGHTGAARHDAWPSLYDTVDAREVGTLIDLLDVADIDSAHDHEDGTDAVTLEFYERGALAGVVGVVHGGAIRCDQRLPTVPLTPSGQRALTQWLAARGVTELESDRGNR